MKEYLIRKKKNLMLLSKHRKSKLKHVRKLLQVSFVRCAPNLTFFGNSYRTPYFVFLPSIFPSSSSFFSLPMPMANGHGCVI